MATEKTTDNGTKYTDHTEQLAATTKEEKRKLLALMAQHGSEARAIFSEQKAAGEAIRKQGIVGNAARAKAGSSLDAISRLTGGLAEAEQGAADASNRELARIQAANAAYLDQVRSQINIEELEPGYSGGSGGGGSRSSSSSGGSGGYDLGGEGLEALPDLVVPSGAPEDYHFAYDEGQTGELEDRYGSDGRKYDADTVNLPVQLRNTVDEMIERGAGRDEVGDYIAQTLDASDMPRWQRAEIMATLDNHYGITEEGVNGTAVRDVYYTSEDQEVDRLRGSYDLSDRNASPESRWKNRQDAQLDRIRSAQAELDSLSTSETTDSSGRRSTQTSSGLSPLDAVKRGRAEERIRSAQEVLRELAEEVEADEDTDFEIEFDPRTFEPTTRQAEPDAADTKYIEQGKTAKQPNKRDDSDRAKVIAAQKAAAAKRQQEREAANRRAAAERRSKIARQAAEARARAKREAEQAAARKRSMSQGADRRVAAQARDLRIKAIREKYGDAFDRDLDNQDEDFLDMYDDDAIDKMYKERKLQSGYGFRPRNAR